MAQPLSRRWLQLVVGCTLLCFFGLIYAWSLFIEPLETEFGWLRSQTSTIFTISVATVSLGMIVAGALESRFGHRIITFAAAAMIVFGFVASAFCHSLIEIFIYYGVFVGLGVGIGFNVAVAVPLKWYPDKQGIASGALLMGYGAGAMVLSPLVTSLLGVLNWRLTFIVLAVLFGLLVVAGALILRSPEPETIAPLLEKAREANIVSAVNYKPGQIVKMPIFWIAFVWLTIVTSGGLAVIGHAVPAAVEVLGAKGATASGLALATLAMGCVSLCNGLGRLLNGFIWDKIGYRVSLIWVSLAFASGMLLCALSVSSGSFPVLLVGFVLLGLMFGGIMSCTSTIAGTFFGTEHFGINYAILCSQMIPAAFIGPSLLAVTQTGSGSYQMAFWAFFGIAVGAFVLSFAVKRSKVVGQEEASAPAQTMNLVGESVA